MQDTHHGNESMSSLDVTRHGFVGLGVDLDGTIGLEDQTMSVDTTANSDHHIPQGHARSRP